MTFNFSDIIFKTQDAIIDSTGIALNGSGEEHMISLWQLIWGYDSMTGEYSITSIIVMTLLFTFSIGDAATAAKPATTFSKISRGIDANSSAIISLAR